MTSFLVRPIEVTDYKDLKEIDILTQIQYLGQEKWDRLSREEKETHLVIQQPDYDGFAKSGYSLLAESEGKILGFILAFETVQVHQELYCKYIAVNPSCQGQGIGVMLFKNLIDIAKKNNIKKIWSLINPDNPNSIKAHLKVGFKLND